jgi:hypothetical protein
MDSDTAIRRLSFAEAHRASSEAMMAMAQHRADRDRSVEAAIAAGDGAAQTHAADDYADRARDAARQIDKTV